MRNKKIYIVLLLLISIGSRSVAQDVLMQTQNIMRQEFLNPAYSSFKDFTSINLMSRYQWINNLQGAPKTYAANVYLPVSLSGFGLGFTAISQSIGLRQKMSFNASFSHNVRVGLSDYLALGYGFGVQNVTYDMNRLLTHTDIDPSSLDLNATDMSVNVGLFFYDPAFLVGLSSNVLFNRDSFDSGWLVPGFDFTTGFMYHVNRSLLFRPEVVVKYYPTKFYLVEENKKNQSMVDPIMDVGINFLLGERLWLGTSHRLGEAQTFSVDMVVRETFKFGYSYELGLGNSLNQISSHGIRLTWNIIPKRAFRGYDRSGRYNMKAMMSTNLYR